MYKLSDLQATIDKYMLLADRNIVKLLCSFVITIRMGISLPWLVIITGSSGGKSMMLGAMASVFGYNALDDATPNAFLSGKQRSDKSASLLHQLPPSGSWLAIKDFSSILSKEKESKRAIIGLLRLIYDGELNRATGQGDKLVWNGKLGVVVGATSSFHSKMQEFADLGERFILYNFKQPDKRAVGQRILDNDLIDDEAKNAMRNAFKSYLDGNLTLPTDQPKLDLQTKADLLDLADLATKARSAVEREIYNRDHPITMPHLEEQIGRFLKQLMGLAFGLITINKIEGISETLTAGDREVLYSIALDSIPLIRRKVLVAMSTYNNVTPAALGHHLGLPTQVVRTAIEDLNIFGLVKKYEGMGRRDTFYMFEQWANTIRRFEHIKSIDEDLTKVPEDDRQPVEDLTPYLPT